MIVIAQNVRAILKGFSESDIAVSRREQEARIRNGSVFSLAKVSLLKFRRIEPANRAAPNRAFLLPHFQRNIVGRSQPPERTDELSILSVLLGDAVQRAK